MYPRSTRRPLAGPRQPPVPKRRHAGVVLGALGCLLVCSAQAARPEGQAPGKAAAKAAAAPATTSGKVLVQQIAAAPLEAQAAEVDPMERLQQRLGERLTTAKPSPGSAGPLEVRVLAKPVAGAGKGTPGARSAAVRGAGKAPASALRGLPWAYEGAAGPQAWGELKPEYMLCAKGQRQSPINIQGGLPVNLDPLQFQYQASPFSVLDTGNTVQATLAAGNFLEVSGQRYELKHLQFRRPSEERIDGRQFDMSLHLVHQDEKGRLAVVSVLLDQGAMAHPALQKVWNSLPLEKHQERASLAALELQELLPEDLGYYTYMGSLTTPPCTEGVQWFVMRQPVAVSAEQIELFSRLYPMNARPVQQLAGRRILQTR